MQIVSDVKPSDGLHRYVLRFSNALFYINFLFLLVIASSYILINNDVPSWLSDKVFGFYIIASILILVFLILFPFAFLIPALIWLSRWFRSKTAAKRDMKYVVLMTSITFGLIIWSINMPFIAVV